MTEQRDATSVEFDHATKLATAELEAAGMPEQARGLLLPIARNVALAALSSERERCGQIVVRIYNRLDKAKDEIEGSLQFAIATENEEMLGELATRRIKMEGALGELGGVIRSLSVAPGSCDRCGGSKLVPTTVVLSGGQRTMVNCPKCVTT